MKTIVAAKADTGAVLAKASARAGQFLGLSGSAIGRSIGVTEPAISRMLRGERPLSPSSKKGELALLLVRIYRALDALVGNDEKKRVAWMHSPNNALDGIPAQLIERVDGLVATLNYLESISGASMCATSDAAHAPGNPASFLNP